MPNRPDPALPGAVPDAAPEEVLPATLARPSVLSLLKESLTVFDVLGAAAAPLQPSRLADCRGQRVVTFPGYGFSDEPLLALRMQLRRLGADATGWGLGRNDGRVERLLQRAGERIEAVSGDAGAPVTLVGWSLGGYIAREVARERPHAVRRVITLASPVVGGPRYTVLSTWFERMGYDLDRIGTRVADRRRVPLTVPVTALYSRRDGVVSWRACIDPECAATEYVAVKATHLGICFAPQVLEVIAERLGRDAAAEPQAAPVAPATSNPGGSATQ